MTRLVGLLAAVAIVWQALEASAAERKKRMTSEEAVQIVLEQAKPLKFPRGNRLPCVIWRMINIASDDEAKTEQTLRELNDRGICAISIWQRDPAQKQKFLDRALMTARIQKKLGIEVVAFANPLLHRFFNGDQSTAHIDDQGQPFFDDSFAKNVKMGCPFAVKHRYDEIRSLVQEHAEAYKRADLPLDLVFADWEIDGPIEWNNAWECSKRCKRCRENIPNIGDFTAFQRALRMIRCEMQRECYAEPIKKLFPKVLVGNYAVNPHDGWRYWYDYFEKPPTEGMAFRTDQRAKYRQWFDEFPLTGFTYANPTIYTWYTIYDWYDFKNPDYHWFYAMLLEVTSVCKNTSPNIPIIAFVHWHTTSPPEGAKEVPQFTAQKYQELLWHMLLRGVDTFAMWCMNEELAEETRLVHEVYAASLEYKEFLDKGTPISFDVPSHEAPVVSGLRLGERVLVIRSDFTEERNPVILKVGPRTLAVPRGEGKPQVIALAK